MHIRITLNAALADEAIRNRPADLFVSCARQINTPSAHRVLRAHERMAEVDIDNLQDLHSATDEMCEAEDAFLEQHGNTEVRL
jgi:prophage DNA circulation protein